MNKEKKEIISDRISELVKENNLYREWEKVSKVIEQAFEENDEVGYGIDELVDEYLKQECTRSMYIENAKDKETGKHYFQIEYEAQDENEGYSVDSQYQILTQNINGVDVDMVSYSMIMKLREMAYLGYVLRQTKEWKEKEI